MNEINSSVLKMFYMYVVDHAEGLKKLERRSEVK